MKILSVGNCGFDHGQLVSLFSNVAPDMTLHGADSSAEAVQAVRGGVNDYALVVVNRVLDRTSESGVALVERLKSEGCTAPIMLISNYADAQAEAMAAGAEPGFGKSQMSDPDLADRLREVLSARGEAATGETDS